MAPVKLEPQDTVFAVSQAILTVLKHSRNATFIENTLTTLQVHTLQEAERRLALQLWLILHRQLGVDIPPEITEEITSQNFQQGRIHCISSTYKYFEDVGEQGQDPFRDGIHFDETKECQDSYSMLISQECKGMNSKLAQSYYSLPLELKNPQRPSVVDFIELDDTADTRVSVPLITSAPFYQQQSYSAPENIIASVCSSPTKKVSSEASGRSSDAEFLGNVNNQGLLDTQEPELDWESMPSPSIQESSTSDHSLKFSKHNCVEESQRLANIDMCVDFSPTDAYKNSQNHNSKDNITHRIDQAMTMLVANSNLQGPNLSHDGIINIVMSDISGNLLEEISQEKEMGHKSGNKDEIQESLFQKVSYVLSTKSCSSGHSEGLKESEEREKVNHPRGFEVDILTLNNGVLEEKSQTSDRHRQNFSCNDLIDMAITKLSRNPYPKEKLHDKHLQDYSESTVMESEKVDTFHGNLHEIQNLKALKPDKSHPFIRSENVANDDCPPSKKFRSISNNCPDMWRTLRDGDLENDQATLAVCTLEQDICHKPESVKSSLNTSKEAAKSAECSRLSLNTCSPIQLERNGNHKNSSDIESDQFTVSERDFDSDFNISKSFEEDDTEHLAFAFDVKTKRALIQTASTNKEHDTSYEIDKQYLAETASQQDSSVKDSGNKQEESISSSQTKNEICSKNEVTLDYIFLQLYSPPKTSPKLDFPHAKQEQTSLSTEAPGLNIMLRDLAESERSKDKTSSVSIIQSPLVTERFPVNENMKFFIQSSDKPIMNSVEDSSNVSELLSYESLLSFPPSPRDKEENSPEDSELISNYSHDILKGVNPVKQPASALSYVSELPSYESLIAALPSPGDNENKSDDENELIIDDLPYKSLQADKTMKHSAVTSSNVSELLSYESLIALLPSPRENEYNSNDEYDLIIDNLLNGTSKAVNPMDQCAAASRNVLELPSYESDIALLPRSSDKVKISDVENEHTNNTHDDINPTEQSAAASSVVSELPSYESLFALLPSTSENKKRFRDENELIFKTSKDANETSGRLSEARTCELPLKELPDNMSPYKETNINSSCCLSDALVMGEYVQISDSDSDISEMDMNSSEFDILDISTFDDDSFSSNNTSNESKIFNTLAGSLNADDEHEVMPEARISAALLPGEPLMASTPYEKVPPKPTRQLALSLDDPSLVVENVATFISDDEVIEETPPKVTLKDYLVQDSNNENIQRKISGQSGHDAGSDEENNSESLLKGLSLDALYAASKDLGCEPFHELPSKSTFKNRLQHNEDDASQHSFTDLLNTTEKISNQIPEYSSESSLPNKETGTGLSENLDKAANCEYKTKMNLQLPGINKIPEIRSERDILNRECKANVKSAFIKRIHCQDNLLACDTDLNVDGKLSPIPFHGNYTSIQWLHPEPGSQGTSCNEKTASSKGYVNVSNDYFTDQLKDVTYNALHREPLASESELPQATYATQDKYCWNTVTDLQNEESQKFSSILESYHSFFFSASPRGDKSGKSNPSSPYNGCTLSENSLRYLSNTILNDENHKLPFLESYHESTTETAGHGENVSEFSMRSDHTKFQEPLQLSEAPLAYELEHIEGHSLIKSCNINEFLQTARELPSKDLTHIKNKKASTTHQLRNSREPESIQDEDKTKKNTEVAPDTQEDNLRKAFSISDQYNVNKSKEGDSTPQCKEFSYIENQISVCTTESRKPSNLDLKQSFLLLQKNSKYTEHHESKRLLDYQSEDQKTNSIIYTDASNRENPDQELTSKSQTVNIDKVFLENLVSEYFPVQFPHAADFLNDCPRDESLGKAVDDEINSEGLVPSNEVEQILSEIGSSKVSNSSRPTQRSELMTETITEANNGVFIMGIKDSNNDASNAQDINKNFSEQQKKERQALKGLGDKTTHQDRLKEINITHKDDTALQSDLLRPKNINTTHNHQNTSQHSQMENKNILEMQSNCSAVINDGDNRRKSKTHTGADVDDIIFLKSIKNKHSTRENVEKISSIPKKIEIFSKQMLVKQENAKQKHRDILLSRDKVDIDEAYVPYNELSMMSVEEDEATATALRANDLIDIQDEAMECEDNVGHTLTGGNSITKKVVESRMSFIAQVNEEEPMIWE